MKKQLFHMLFACVLAAMFASSAAPVYALCTINGVVFRDFNDNGTRAAPLEAGTGNIVITAYQDGGTVVATATTDAFGAYSMTTIPDNTPIRLEMTIPATSLFPGAAGVDADTSVQFVNCGAGSVFNGQDFNVNNPAQYCQPNPELVTSCYTFGDLIAGPNANRSDVITYPYQSGSVANPATSAVAPGGANIHTPQLYTTRAIASQVGSVWGTSYQPASDTIFVAAMLKRHVSFGPTDNPGTIYRIDMRTGTVAPYVTLPAGANPHTLANPIGGAGFPPYYDDIGAFNAVGYIGLGDIDISDDAGTLFAVNLFDNNLYMMTLGSSAGGAPLATTAVALPIGLPGAAVGCPGAVRPGALKTYDNVTYAGLTCTGPTVNDLRAYVYAFQGGFSAAPVAEFALNYDRGCASRNGACDPAPADNPAEWVPWVTDLNGDPADDPDTAAPPDNDGTSGIFTQVYTPQPWLLDIEIDEFGYMIVNLADRAGFQLGNRIAPANTGPVEGVIAGDLLRLAPNGATWLLENNGSSGNPATQQGAATTGGAGNAQGPGNGEFYFQDNRQDLHDEVVTGGITQIYGTGEIVASAFDPASMGAIRTSGTIYLSHATGGRTRSVEIVPQDAPGTFGKAAGIGDVEALCGPPPLEIGNRVWYDPDVNGVQDPGEIPFGGVTVRLYLDENNDSIPDGPAIGVAITDAQGRYLFRGARSFPGVPDPSANADGLTDANPADSIGIVGQFYDINVAGGGDPRFATNNANRGMNEPRGIMPLTGYVIRLDNPADYNAGGPLFNLYATAFGTGGADANGVIRDSNGIVANPLALANGTTNIPTFSLRTVRFGMNNHTYDFGFAPISPVLPPTPTPPGGSTGSGSGGSGSSGGVGGDDTATPTLTTMPTLTATPTATVNPLQNVQMLPATGDTPLRALRWLLIGGIGLLLPFLFRR
jgi:hypothetical protein